MKQMPVLQDLRVGYGPGLIEPGVIRLVEAVWRAGYRTFSSCEGHEGREFPSLGNVAFAASEADARLVHQAWLETRDSHQCSWILDGGFVCPFGAEFILGWTLENHGIVDSTVAEADFERRSIEAGRDHDMPIWIRVFDEIGRHRQAAAGR